MTREEAIEILRKNRPTSDPRPCGVELCDAVDMAISAIRQQDVTDTDVWKNEPLTLDELRMMSGDPAFVVTDRLKEWCIVHSHHSDDVIGGGIIMTRRTAEKRTYPYACYGENWLAYRQKPEEG